MEFVPNEKAMPIRYPSVANLMVDSADRVSANYSLCNDFQINKKNSLLNGFFTRVGATEVVMEWNTPNVSLELGGDITYTVNGTNYPAGGLLGFYNIEEALTQIEGELDSKSGTTGVTVALNNLNGGGAGLTFTGAVGTTIALVGPIIRRLYGGQNISTTIPLGGAVTVEFSPGLTSDPPDILI
jgi:hypothetical protein